MDDKPARTIRKSNFPDKFPLEDFDISQPFIGISLIGLIDHLKEKGLSYPMIARLFGTCPAQIGLYKRGETKTCGIKVGASVLRQIRIEGSLVVLDFWDSPSHVVQVYKQFYVQFAHGDGKLHSVGLNGLEHEVFHA